MEIFDLFYEVRCVTDIRRDFWYKSLYMFVYNIYTGKCSLVFSKDLWTKYIVFYASNLSGYLTHVVQWTGAIWPSSSLRAAVVVPRILQAEKLDSCQMNICQHWRFALHSKLPIIPWKKCMKLNNKCVLTTWLNESFRTTINRFLKL